MLKEVNETDLGIQVGSDKVRGKLFADDLIGVSGTKEGLQKLSDVVHKVLKKVQDVIISYTGA